MHSLFRFAVATLGFAAAATTAGAQTYSTSIIARGLNRPLGIAVHASGDLYFTELPDPGRFSQRNTVSMRDAASGSIQALVRGEPGPTNIAVLADRSFYWTCNTVGPIMRGFGTSHRTIATGRRPSGIAVTPAGRVFITQVPQPGRKNGANNVAEVVGSTITTLRMGEPEPVDVAADKDGNLYWTCKTAGVILRRDGRSGSVSLVLDGLEQPNGIAMDAVGSLYFTEVPTPGKFGNQGGRNKVWKYSPSERRLTLIKFGDPEPNDVTVSADGSQVYWTCTTAGVIMRAVRTGAAPAVTTQSTTRLGDTVALRLSAPGNGGKVYLAASSTGLGPIPFDSRFLALSPDPLFAITLANLGAPTFNGYFGQLDRAGTASASISIPSDPSLRGININTAFVVLEMTAPSGVATGSDTLHFKVQ